MGYINPDPDFYTTDAFTTYAIERLDEYKNEDKPFVLYLPYTAPHYPLHAWPDDIAKYRGKFKDGWDELRENRFARMKKMGIIGENHKLTPRAVEGVGRVDRRAEGRGGPEDGGVLRDDRPRGPEPRPAVCEGERNGRVGQHTDHVSVG